jgi:hypothetical protein
MSIARRVLLAIAEDSWSHFGVQDFNKFRTGLALTTGIIGTTATSYAIHSDKRVAEQNPWIIHWILSSASGTVVGLGAFLAAGTPALVVGVPVTAGLTCLGKKLQDAQTASVGKKM